jgi:hypothetical protein
VRKVGEFARTLPPGPRANGDAVHDLHSRSDLAARSEARYLQVVPSLVRFSILLLLAAVIAVAPQPARAQKPKTDVCPWCKNDPDTMKKAGIVTHGPMPIGPKTSTELAAELPGPQWIFLETEHIRWASSLPAVVVELADQERVEAELARLRLLLPDVPQKVKKLDPWLRLHLIAMKGEEFYARFEKLLAVTDDQFGVPRTDGAPFMGDGKYLGEKNKFEVVLHASHITHNQFTKDFSGTQVTGSLRWHFPDHRMLVSIPCEDPDYKKDRLLFPHVVHNLSHLFLSAYKHFTYYPPAWIDEGVALAMEKEIDPRSMTNEGEEGTLHDRVSPPDWDVEVRKMIARGRHKHMAELMYVKELGELDSDALYTCWSIARFWMETRPADLAKFLGGVKGQLDANGQPSGKDLPDLQRRLLKEICGWTPSGLDEEWKTWATRPLEPEKK